MSIVKQIAPPILVKAAGRWFGNKNDFRGRYSSWEAATAASASWANPAIIESVVEAILKVKQGLATYERDSAIFDRQEILFPLAAALLRVAALHGNRLSVLDFGGSLGSTYLQCRDFLAGTSDLQWCVVELPNYVERGRSIFRSEEIRFFSSMDECLETEKPNVVLFSSVLQYIDTPYILLEQVAQTPVRHLVIDRTPFMEREDDVLTVQAVQAPEIYHGTAVSFPARLFGRRRLHDLIRKYWKIVAEFDALDGRWESSVGNVRFKGVIADRL